MGYLLLFVVLHRIETRKKKTVKVMKKLIFKISLLSFLIFENAYGGNISTQQINKHTIQQENTLKFEFDYAGNSFIKEDDLKALKNNEVIQIDLIYTQFHRAEDFDQAALNNKRIATPLICFLQEIYVECSWSL